VHAIHPKSKRICDDVASASMCFGSKKLRDCSIIFIEIYARKAVKSFSMKLGHRSPSEVIADGETDPSIKVKVQESAAFYYHNLTVVAEIYHLV